MDQRIIVTGASGQDGSYMLDYLLENTDAKIFALIRHSTKVPDENIKHLFGNDRVEFIEGDLLDAQFLRNFVCSVMPDYFFNFAAQSHVHFSWKSPELTWNTNTLAVLNILEVLRKECPKCRFLQASSSEMFGDVVYSPQDEKHPLRPRSVYGASKCAAHHLVKVYRESYGLYAVGSIGFNHESKRRHESFVTRKITKGVCRILKEILETGRCVHPIELGNLDVKRDWSHALDFCDGMWRMLNQEKYLVSLGKLAYSSGSILLPFEVERKNCEVLSKHIKDYVLSSNETHSVREFVELAFQTVKIKGVWRKGFDDRPESESYLLSPDGKIATKLMNALVVINPEFYRPAEVNALLGNSNLIRGELGWKPKYSFSDLINEMVGNDLESYGL